MSGNLNSLPTTQVAEYGDAHLHRLGFEAGYLLGDVLLFGLIAIFVVAPLLLLADAVAGGGRLKARARPAPGALVSRQEAG